MTSPTTMTDLPPLSPVAEAEETVDPSPILPPQPREPRVPLALSILEYISLSILIVQGAIVFALHQTDRLTPRFFFIFLLSGSISLGLFLLFALINQQIGRHSHRQQAAVKLQYQATLWAVGVPEPDCTAIVAAREKALGYCQTLIQDYQQRRWVSRNLYYSLQIAIICLSGITPILILLDKLQPSGSWLGWLPVIFPAVAAIVASIVIAIPFQTTWLVAQARVARLVAEQEKFVLGVTSAYAYPLETDPQQKAQQAIDTFIRKINAIHLDRVQDHEIH